MPQNKLPILLGPTASGKTKLAVSLADYFNGEIISADSRQIFNGMDVGTGKDLNEYNLYSKKIPHHLINIKNAGENYNVNEFKEDFYIAYQDILKRQKVPFLCGGTGMYVHSILQNHQLTAVPKNEELRSELLALSKEELIAYLEKFPKELRSKADYSSGKRLIRAIEIANYLAEHELPSVSFPEINPVVIGLYNEIDIRRKRIIDRLELRLKNGLIEEVEKLLVAGVSAEMLVFYGLEYKFVVSYLSKQINYPTLVERLGIAICQFAKRQMTFFRKMEKDGVQIHWLNADTDFILLKEEAIQFIEHEFESK